MIEVLAAWTLEKLESNPALFGGDNGNSVIILEYLKEASPHNQVTLITHQTMSNAVTVSRLKNTILLDRPDLDHRVKNHSRTRQDHHDGQTTIWDFMDDVEIRIVEYLNADVRRWDFSAARIKKSIRGADLDDIKCVLKHRELYAVRQEKPAVDDVSEDTRRQKRYAVEHSL